MNEQTKELAMKYANKMGNSVIHNAEHLEQFAELIVQECISIAQDRAAFDWAAPNDVNHIISEIKEHFGVEE